MAERVDLDAAEQRDREHGRLDLDNALAWIAEAKSFVDEESDPQAYIAAALQDAEDMAAELRVAREVEASARAASLAVERVVDRLVKDRATWDDDIAAMWAVVQTLQQDLSRYDRHAAPSTPDRPEDG